MAGPHTPRSDPSDAHPTGEKTAKWQLSDAGVMTWFLGAHVVLGASLYAGSATVANIHAFGTLAGCVWVAMSTRRMATIGILAGYIVGSEILWRMTGASTFWETGKYGVIGILSIGLLRFFPTRSLRAPTFYFVLLLPSIIVLAQNAVDLADVRDQISFNLSGPLALAVSACFFRQLNLSKAELGAILVAFVGPVVSVAVLTLLFSSAAGSIVFTLASNASTSGGFGPNQVSSMLGLAAVACFLLLAAWQDLGAYRRGMLFTILVVCSVQGAMTFSRGGPYMSTVAISCASLFLLRDYSARRLVIGSAVVLGLLYGVIEPRLNSRTGGALAQRFQEKGMTGRADLMEAELQIFATQPVFGMGVGLAALERRLGGTAGVAAHTEWTRMLAEHGMFGLFSMLVLLVMMAENLGRARGAVNLAIVASLLLWSSSYLAINAMRLVAPSFLIGLTCATFEAPAGWASRVARRVRFQPHEGRVRRHVARRLVPIRRRPA